MCIRQPFAAALFALLPACQTSPPAAISEADKAAMRSLDESFTGMVLAGDFKTIVERFYTEDAHFMAPNAPDAAGRAQIEAALRALPPLTAFALHSEEMAGAGDLAYSRGRYTMTLSPPGAAAIHDQGKFLVVYRRQADGSWKVSHDIFNSDLPPKP
jgi:ketosteroid isomerase-like protein